MSKIEVDHVSHFFGADEREILALDDVSLRVEAGEFLAIVGPSGCGKSTVLNMMAGLLKPDYGTVCIDGATVDSGRMSGQIGYMLARDCLFPWRTAQQNVELSIELLGRKTSIKSAAVTEILDKMRLSGFAQSFPSQLSQGMRQRVAIARTLVRRPEILLMDEPFGALDAQTRLTIQGEFLDLWKSTNSTVVLVTHDLVEAVSLAQRIIVFSRRPGRILREYKVPALKGEAKGHEGPFDPRKADLYKALWDDLREESLSEQ